MKGNPEYVVISLAFFLMALFLLVLMVAPEYIEFAVRFFYR